MSGSKDDQDRRAAIEARGYRRMISIDMRHAYCNGTAGERFTGVEVAPTEETARRLSLYDMIARPRPDGLDVLYCGINAYAYHHYLLSLREAFGDVLPAEIQDRLFRPPLLFTLRLTNPHFFNFTEAPTNISTGKPALWLSNRHMVPVEDQEGQGERDKGGASPALETAQLRIDWHSPRMTVFPWHPPKSRITPKAPDARTTAATADPDAEPDPLEEFRFESAGSIEKARRERVELRVGYRPQPLPLGFVELYLSPPAGSGRRGVGEWNGHPLDFAPPATLPPEAVSDMDNYIRPSTYQIRFAARRTRWRYLVAGRGHALDDDSLSITDGTESFERNGHVVLPDGGKAIRFESRKPFPLRQRPDRAFVLQRTPQSAGRRPQKLIDPLPAPTADRILPDPAPAAANAAPPTEAAATTAWSEVYVFV